MFCQQAYEHSEIYFIKAMNASFQCLMPCLYIVLYYVVYPQGIYAFWNFQINICSALFCLKVVPLHSHRLLAVSLLGSQNDNSLTI